MLKGLKRRDIFILIGLWLVIASLMCGLVVWFVALRPTGPSSFAVDGVAATPGEAAVTPDLAPTHTVTFVEVTARQLYPAAEASARAWEPDAQLVGANAVWSNTAINLVGNPTDWSFRFYSPSRTRLYLVGVTRDGEALGAPHFQKESSPPLTINPETWTVDSPQALARWLDHGGGELLGQNPGAEVTMQLGVDPASGQAAWIVTGLDSAGGQPMSLQVDAATGQISVFGGEP